MAFFPPKELALRASDKTKGMNCSCLLRIVSVKAQRAAESSVDLQNGSIETAWLDHRSQTTCLKDGTRHNRPKSVLTCFLSLPLNNPKIWTFLCLRIQFSFVNSQRKKMFAYYKGRKIDKVTSKVCRVYFWCLTLSLSPPSQLALASLLSLCVCLQSCNVVDTVCYS